MGCTDETCEHNITDGRLKSFDAKNDMIFLINMSFQQTYENILTHGSKSLNINLQNATIYTNI